jgi:hypothetical protein
MLTVAAFQDTFSELRSIASLSRDVEKLLGEREGLSFLAPEGKG